jgi:hypothetical protein
MSTQGHLENNTQILFKYRTSISFLLDCPIYILETHTAGRLDVASLYQWLWTFSIS